MKKNTMPFLNTSITKRRELIMSTIEYEKMVGIISKDGRFRLDISTDAMKQNIPATHDSWATRLVIKRLDGPSSGAVSDDQVVGIFSEDGKVRLDIGHDATKKDIPATHYCWGTRLIIKRLDGSSSGDVCYDHVVGIFSQDGKYRLDISTSAMKKDVPAKRDCWATRLKIKLDPIVDVEEISSIEYDTKGAKILQSAPAELYHESHRNNTDVQQTFIMKSSASVSETSGWSDALGFKVGITSSFEAQIPFVAKGEVKVSAEVSNTYTWNGSTTRTKEWEFEAPLNVPARTVVEYFVSATVSRIAVPYTLTGTFVHESGARVRGKIKGTYTGNNSHDLVIEENQLDPVTAKILTKTEVLKASSSYYSER